MDEGEDQGAEPRVSSEVTSDWKKKEKASGENVTEAEQQFLSKVEAKGEGKVEKEKRKKPSKKLSPEEFDELSHKVDARKVNLSSASKLAEIDKEEIQKQADFSEWKMPLITIVMSTILLLIAHALLNATRNGVGFQLDAACMLVSAWETLKVMLASAVLLPVMIGVLFLVNMLFGVNTGRVISVPARLYALTLGVLSAGVLIGVLASILCSPGLLVYLSVMVVVFQVITMMVIFQALANAMFELEGDLAAGTVFFICGIMAPITTVWVFTALHHL